MDVHAEAERRRLVIQDDCDADKTQQERNRLGQFATPTSLAMEVLEFAERLLPSKEAVCFLDPAIGTGSFYSALLRVFASDRITKATGVEIDRHYGEPAQELWKKHSLDFKLGDFTKLAPPNAQGRFNLIICNPPYVRHHHIDGDEKIRLQNATAKACGVTIGGLAGLYCYFLGLAHAWMADDGIAGWLIPSEFMDVNYGANVKRYLLTQVELLRIHRFDPNELQFGDALVSSAVVWFRKRRPARGHTTAFSYGGTLKAPKVSRTIAHAELQSALKWTGLAERGVKAVSEGPKLADFFAIKRGLATGDNRFFIMTKPQIEERGLPMEFFKPILPGPRHLPDDVIEAAKDGTPKIEKLQFILDCPLSEAKVKTLYPELWTYLETGKSDVSETYLCRHRKPWYAQENRPPPPFLCTYMGRGLEKRAKPFRFILNKSRATAANVYLLLYPKAELAAALAKKPALATQVWEFLNSISSGTLLGEGRVYGGGLYKMEPKELANVQAIAILDLLAENDIRTATQAGLFDGQAA